MESAVYYSPVGPLAVEACDEGIARIQFLSEVQATDGETEVANHRHLSQLWRELDRYFSGGTEGFTCPLAPRGTDFQLRVWRALTAVPRGRVTSYGEIAHAIGAPKAARAVGGANNRNPLPIIIPCHRVIGKSGSLVGYGGQLWRKRFLLELEGYGCAATAIA